MVRLIDADALMKDIEQYHLSEGMFQHWVEVQPTIDAVPVVHGHWTFDAEHYDVDCSVCNESFPWVTPYCPHCGARMDEVE